MTDAPQTPSSPLPGATPAPDGAGGTGAPTGAAAPTATASPAAEPAAATPGESVLLPADWPVQAADTVERVVSQVRERTTVPAMTAIRGVVYGLLAAIVAITALVLVCVGIVRVLDVLIPRGVWIAYAILGTVLVVAGAIFWSQRHEHDPTT